MTSSTRITTEDDDLVVIDGETYYRFPHGGGLVAITANVSPHAYVDRGARVKGRAVLTGSARLFGNAIAEDDAYVGSMVTLRDHARVGGHAVVKGGVNLRDESYVGGASHLSGPLVMQGKCRVVDQTIHGRFVIY